MTWTPPENRPALDDARKAADAIIKTGAETVLLFGSVASGTQSSDSDIDIIAIYEDLGDYNGRHNLEIELGASASSETDFPCSVMVTDRLEWSIRSGLPAAIEYEVRKNHTVLHGDPKRKPPNYDKTIGRPDTALGEARIYSTKAAIMLGLAWHTYQRLQYIDMPKELPRTRAMVCGPAALSATCAVTAYIKGVKKMLPKLTKTSGKFTSALSSLTEKEKCKYQSIGAIYPTSIDKWVPEDNTDCAPLREASGTDTRSTLMTAAVMCKFAARELVATDQRHAGNYIQMQSTADEVVPAKFH